MSEGNPPPKPINQENQVVSGKQINIQTIEGSVGQIGDTIIQVMGDYIQRSEQASRKSFADEDAKCLARGIRRYSQKLQSLVETTRENGRQGNPYKSLASYELRDFVNFYGRTKAIEAFIGRLGQRRFTVLHAESGTGKSSLLQAGILPRLITSGQLPVIVQRYYPDPVNKIKKSLVVGENLTPALESLTLRDFFHQATDIFEPVKTTIYIILDQFEEIFTRVDPPERQKFIQSLADCLDDETLRVSWIVSVRNNYLNEVSELNSIIPNPLAITHPLKALTLKEAKEVMTAPLEHLNVRFEPELVQKILAELGTENILPAYLQMVCNDLYNHLSEGESVITEHLYQSRGGAKGITENYLSKELKEKFVGEQRKVARRLLEALVTSDGRRAIRSQKDLIREGMPETPASSVVIAVLNKLIESRICRRLDVEELGVSYELVHDLLIQEIELSPEVKARKEAEELLARGMARRQRHQLLIPAEELKIIELQAGKMRLGDESLALLALSAAAAKRRPQQWLKQMSEDGRARLTQELTTRPVRQLAAWEIDLLWHLRRRLSGELLPIVAGNYLFRRAIKAAVVIGTLFIVVVVTANALEFILPPIETGWQKVPIHFSEEDSIQPDELVVDTHNSGKIFILDIEQHAIFAAEGPDRTWTKICEIPTNETVEDFDVESSKYYLLTSDNIYFQENGCDWQQIASPDRYRQENPLQALEVHSGSPEVIYVAIANHGLFKTNDRGGNWEHIPQMTANTVYAIASRDTFVAVATDEGIWHSNDNGETWFLEPNETTNPNEFGSVVDIVFPSDISKDLIYMAFQDGLLREANTGNPELREWRFFEQPLVEISALDAETHKSLFAIANRNLYCWRQLHWQQLAWWATRLGLSAPCGDEGET